MARYRTAFFVIVALAWRALAPAQAHAYEDQASLDLALGYTLLVDAPNLPEHGVALDVGGALGISDLAALRALAGYAPLVDNDGVSHAGRLRIEALYLIDVLQFVPFFGLGASLLLADERTAALLVLPGGHLLFGADYLLSRTWTIGIDVRTGIMFERGEVRSFSDISLRFSRMFETF